MNKNMKTLLIAALLLLSIPTQLFAFTIKIEKPTLTIGGKNSVFNKPLGTGSGSLNNNIKDFFKATNKAVTDINREIGVAHQDISREIKTLEQNTDNSFTKIKNDLNSNMTQTELDQKFEDSKLAFYREMIPKQGEYFQTIAVSAGVARAALRRDYGKLESNIIKQGMAEINGKTLSLSQNISKELKKLNERLDDEFTKIKHDLDRELTKAKKDTDNTLTKARVDTETEWNQGWGTLCGKSSEQLALDRKLNQGEITEKEYNIAYAKAKPGRQGSCGAGDNTTIGSDGKTDTVLTDGKGVPSEKPTPKPEIVITPEPVVIDIDLSLDIFIEDESTPIVKPPFSATPLGQDLSPGVRVQDAADATPTPGSGQAGGHAGNTRSGGKVYHGGFDDAGKQGSTNEISRYYGPGEGEVTVARKATNGNDTSYGMRVTVVYTDHTGTWESTTLHHHEVLVNKGDRVQPGDPIARGIGAGDQFKSPNSGPLHVHWRLIHNGKPVDPMSGKVLKKEPDA